MGKSTNPHHGTPGTDGYGSNGSSNSKGRSSFSRYLGSLGVAVDTRPAALDTHSGNTSAFGTSRLDSLLPEEPRKEAAHRASLVRQPTLTHIGRYELKSVISESGLGRVYQAWDPLSRRPVALKSLQFDLDIHDRVSLDRALLQAGRAAMQLQHRHIVPVLESGLSAHGIFVASEFQPGRDLRQALAVGWAPSPEQGARMVRRVADALTAALQKGMVHGNLKPANVMLDGEGRPRVLDFGMARAVRESRLVRLPELPGHGLCTVAPEVLAGQLPDARSDVYSLGVLLYEVLTGWQAFGPATRAEILQAARAGRPIAARQLRPAVPLHLSDLAERAMSADTAERPSHAGRFADELRQGLHLAAPSVFKDTQPADMVETPRKAGPLLGPVLGLFGRAS